MELGPVAAGQVPKDLDFKYEYLVKGLQYVRIKVRTLLWHLYVDVTQGIGLAAGKLRRRCRIPGLALEIV